MKYYVNNKLKLELNRKSCYYPSRLGIDFCGYIIHEDYILVMCEQNINLSKDLGKGYDVGERNKQLEIARNLLKNNVSIDIIINSTGLTKEEIESL